MKEYNHNPHKLCSVVSSKHVSVTAVTPGAAGLSPDPAAAAGADSGRARLVERRLRRVERGRLAMAAFPGSSPGEDDIPL